MADPSLRGGNPSLERLLAGIGPGTLRFGGNSAERTLWASENPGKPPPSAETPASAARSSRGNSESHVLPISKNETTPAGEGSCGSRSTSL